MHWCIKKKKRANRISVIKKEHTQTQVFSLSLFGGNMENPTFLEQKTNLSLFDGNMVCSFWKEASISHFLQE